MKEKKFEMTDADALRDVSDQIKLGTADKDDARTLDTIADRLEKREAFTKAAEAYCQTVKDDSMYMAKRWTELQAAYRAMKEENCG